MSGEGSSFVPEANWEVEADAKVAAIFSALYLPHMGGVETYTAGLAHELAARGYRVVVATSRLSEANPVHETQPDGVEVLRFPCRAS